MSILGSSHSQAGFLLRLIQETGLLTLKFPFRSPWGPFPIEHGSTVHSEFLQRPSSSSLTAQAEEGHTETIIVGNSLCPEEKTEPRGAEAGTGVLGRETLNLIPSHF